MKPQLFSNFAPTLPRITDQENLFPGIFRFFFGVSRRIFINASNVHFGHISVAPSRNMAKCLRSPVFSHSTPAQIMFFCLPSRVPIEHGALTVMRCCRRSSQSLNQVISLFNLAHSVGNRTTTNLSKFQAKIQQDICKCR